MKIKQLLLAAAAMVMAVACTDPVEETPEVQLSVEPAQVEFVAEGGEETVALTANAAWTAEPSAEWIALDVTSGTEGQNVKVTVAENEAEEAREGKVVFTAGEKKAELVVKQAAAEAPTCAATAIIAEEYDVEVSQWDTEIAFYITTANAVEAAYMYKLTSLVDDTYTADYILTDGNMLSEGDTEWDGLNKENFKVYIWADFETEYTFFLAVKDAEGLTKLVTKTITAPKAPTAYEDWEMAVTATIDTEFGESVVDFVGENYRARVTLVGAIETNMQYNFLDEEWPTSVYITSAKLLQPDGLRVICELTTATLEIMDDPWMGSYTSLSGTGVDENGETIVVTVGCMGLPEGLGGGEPGLLEFTVAKAKFYHSNGNDWGIEPNDKRYFLELTSTDGLEAVFTIDNYYSLETWQGGTPVLQGQFLAVDPEYPEDPGISIMDSWMTMHQMTSFDYLVVESGMSAGQDANMIQAQFTAVSYMTGVETTVVVKCDMPIAMYGAGESGVVDFDPTSYGVSEFEHNCDNQNVVTLIARTNSGNLVFKLATTDGTFASAEGMYFSVEEGNLSGYFYDFLDDVDYNFVEGGVTVSVVDGQYSWTVGEGGCFMQDVDGTRKYSIVPGTYNFTIAE